MEEIDDFQNEGQNILGANTVNIRSSDIVKLFSLPENRNSFAIENSKFGFDATFMLQVLSGEKKVKKYIIFLVFTFKSCK